MSPVPAAALLAALAAAALLADRTISVAIIAAGLFALCLRAPRGRRWPYLAGTLVSGLVLFLFSPLVARYGGVVYWEGPEVPVIGRLDVTSPYRSNRETIKCCRSYSVKTSPRPSERPTC